jgi:hypothetical protein
MSASVLLAGLACALLPAGAGAQAADPLDGVRRLYLEGVRDEAAVPLGLREIEELRTRGEAPPGSTTEVVLSAYRGAITTLRAKHGFWPPARLRHMRQGLTLLDGAVAARPDVAEIRYLRLLSCYFLPGVLGRGGSVREDFAALARLLPAARDDFPQELYAAMVRFVLENGEPGDEERRQLRAVLDDLGDE